MTGKRETYAAIIVLILLLPGVSYARELPPVTIPVPPELPIGVSGPTTVSVSVLLFTVIPTLFIILMIVEATGHIRERKPPS